MRFGGFVKVRKRTWALPVGVSVLAFSEKSVQCLQITPSVTVMKSTASYVLSLVSDKIPEFEGKIPLEIPANTEFGDYAVACFALAKALRKAPPAIAAELLPRFADVSGVTVTALGPYLNFAFTDTLRIADLRDGVVTFVTKNEKILVEYSSPNTNKPQHLGHIRNNFLGMAVSRMLEKVGYEVVKCAIFNDRGIAICKSMIAYKYLGNGETPESSGLKGDHLVGKYYVLYGKLCEDLGKERIEEETSEMLRKWEAGDTETRALWKMMNEWTISGWRHTYDKQGCEFDLTYYESETYLDGKEIVQDGLSRGLFGVKENGAIFADLTGYGLDEKILQRGDGTSIYITQDLGTTLRKFNEHRMNRSIWVVANEQDYHFKVLFALLDLLGYKDHAKNCFHLSYGYISLPSGRMKSREGTVVDADELVEELEAMALAALIVRNPDMSDEEQKHRAAVIAMAALKFHFLHFGAASDFIFNPEESISFEGKTGPYILYSYARIRSVFRKLGDTSVSAACEAFAKGSFVTDSLEADERSLLKQILAYGETLDTGAEKYDPSVLAKYLYELARTINSLYHSLPVISEADEAKKSFRIALLHRATEVLREGLYLLGIETLEEM